MSVAEEVRNQGVWELWILGMREVWILGNLETGNEEFLESCLAGLLILVRSAKTAKGLL